MKIKTNGGNFQPCPEYTGSAVCVDVTPLKSVQTHHGPKEKFRFVFEIGETKDDGSRWCVWPQQDCPDPDAGDMVADRTAAPPGAGRVSAGGNARVCGHERSARHECHGPGNQRADGRGIGDFLELALTAAELETTPAQRDTLAIWLWLISAARVHKVAMKNGCADSPLTDVVFDPQAAPEDNDWCPPEIRAAATRINFDLDTARAVFYRDKVR